MGGLLGGWALLPSSIATESLGRAGFDFIGIDVQHGAFGFESAVSAIQLLDVMGVPSYVRVAARDLSTAPRLLDFGATGVIVATVEDGETAQEAVSLARYQPEGMRSYAGQRYGLHAEPESPLDVRPEVWVMIETLTGAGNVASIAAVAGLSGLYVGPSDLALAYGVKPGTGNGSDGWRRTIEAVIAESHAAGIEAGSFATDGADARSLLEQGFDRVVIASDLAILRSGLARELAIGRRLDPNLAAVDVAV